MHVLAYIDPGAGSLVIQALIAAAVSVPIMFRKTIRRMFDRFQKEEPGDQSTREQRD